MGGIGISDVHRKQLFHATGSQKGDQLMLSDDPIYPKCRLLIYVTVIVSRINDHSQISHFEAVISSMHQFSHITFF